MKKIMLLLTLAILSISSICYAFDPPNSNRWFWVGSDDKYGFWIDKQTLNFNIDYNKYSTCYKHKIVTAWILNYTVKDDTHMISREVYDIDCRKSKMLSYVIYNSNNEVIHSYTFNYPEYEPIIPNSWGENILTSLDLLYLLNTIKD